MRTRLVLLVLALSLAAALVAVLAHEGTAPATLKARARLPASATAAAPWPGGPDLEPVVAADSTQPVGGFSALLDAPGKHTLWAMPDNGFGSKANSRSFVLRVYRVRARFETKHGGPGTVEIRDWITLRDPNHKIPFAIVREETSDRLLTGGDLDIESMRADRHGNLWFGDEFGPFLVKTDRTGKLLRAPIPLPDVKSPDFPADVPAPLPGAANLERSNGFEAMAAARDGRRLLATLEGPVSGDQPLVRRVYEFDIVRNRYTGRVWQYRVADPSLLVSDLTALDRERFVALERDNLQGTGAKHERGFVVRFGDAGRVAKRELVDMAHIADPHEISLPARVGDVESVLPIGHNRLAFVNDTNFGLTDRKPSRPADSDFIVVELPGLR